MSSLWHLHVCQGSYCEFTHPWSMIDNWLSIFQLISTGFFFNLSFSLLKVLNFRTVHGLISKMVDFPPCRFYCFHLIPEMFQLCALSYAT